MFRAPPRTSVVTGVLTVAVAVLLSSTGPPSASAGAPGEAGPALRPASVIRGDRSAAAIPGSYLIVFEDTGSVRAAGVATRARVLTGAHHGTLGSVWQHATRGFAATMSRDDALQIAAEPDVRYVVQDQRLANGGSATPTPPDPAAQPDSGTQTPASWGLDRIDQHALPLDNHYSYDESAGQGVQAYIFNTGIAASHPDFGGRVVAGGNFVNDGRPSTSDCQGGGTKMAGIVGGTQYGVAKKVSLVSVRTADCQNFTTTSKVVNGFDWVVDNAVLPGIILFLLLDYCVDSNGNPVACDPGAAEIVVNAQESAFNAGLPVFGAAGESAQDTCVNATGAAPDTVYVGATTATDARAGSSNFGPCVTMFAPGSGISTDDPTGTSVVSSSGAAAAFVAGAAALFAGKEEFAGASPDQIRDELVQNRSTPNVVTGLTANTPNRLLFTGPPGFFTVGDSASLTRTDDGRLELFGVDRAGHLFHRKQTAAGSGSWTPWSQSVTKGWLSVGAEPNADGRLALLGLTPSGELWIRQETAPDTDTWSTWARLNPTGYVGPMVRAVMAHNNSNRLEIFATDRSGQAYYRSQLAPGSKVWTAWNSFNFAGKLRSITAVGYADGRIEVLAVDDAGQIWRTTQNTATDNNWSSFSRLNGFGMTSIAVARNANGKLELVGVDAGGGAWRRSQTTVGSWGDWTALTSKTLSRVTAEANADGRIQLVGVDTVGRVWQATQTTANASTYTGWSPVDGLLRP